MDAPSTQSKKLVATIETSGRLRMVVDPWLADMLRSCCQKGIGNTSLIPPPLLDQVVSEAHEPSAPAVDRDVPPTTVMVGSSAGSQIGPEYAP